MPADLEDHPLILPSQIVQPSDSVKYLGIYLDERLVWDAHLQRLEKKSSKWLAALPALGNSAWGVSLIEMCQVYRGTVLPLFLNCTSCWFVPSGGYRYEGMEEMSLILLRRIQKRAACIIAGAFKTTSGKALDIELHLQPVKQQLDIVLDSALLRIASGPTYETLRQARPPLEPPYLDKKYNMRSPLGKLEERFNAVHHIEPSSIERKLPFITTPWWTGPSITIDPTSEEAQQSHDALVGTSNHLVIYTDGSGIDYAIGASACTIITPMKGCPPIITTKRQAYLGLQSGYTVYFGELYGIYMALDIAKVDRDLNQDHSPVVIFTANKAAIRSVHDPQNQFGQYMVSRIIERLNALGREG